MSDWTWQHDPGDLLDRLRPEALTEVDRLARVIAVQGSVIFRDGVAYGRYVPTLRTERQGRLMVRYLTDVRRGRIVIVQVTWFD